MFDHGVVIFMLCGAFPGPDMSSTLNAIHDLVPERNIHITSQGPCPELAQMERRSVRIRSATASHCTAKPD